MADRYWVGGTGNWSSTARWSASSGGASGASVPTSADNVFFDANSAGAPNVDFTVTVDATSNCADIDIGVTSALTKIMTLAGSSTLNVYGSWKNATSATYTRTFTGTIFFLATTTGKVITTNGVTLTTGSINFNGAGGGWTLGSALTVGPTSGTGTITVTQGTFDTSSTGNYSVTTSAFISTGTSARTINLNASTITLNFEGAGLNLSGSNITFNAGTSQINHTAFTPTIIVGGFTLYNFSFTNAFAGNANLSLSNGAATFNNFTVVGPTSETTGLRTLQVIGNNVTINGALTLGSANTVIKRVQVFSDVMGTQRTFTFNGAASTLTTLSNVDFRDIVFATAGGSPVSLPASGTKLGDGGNNSQITFAAGTNCYWTGNTSGGTNDNRWSNSSGGAASTAFFPLAQDTLIFDQSGTPANHTVTNSRSFWFGALDFSARSTAITFATGTTSIVLFKALTLSSAVTLTGTTGAFSFQQGAGSQVIDITPAGVAFTQNIIVNVNPTSSVRLLGNITNSDTARSVTLTSGTLNLNGNTLSYGLFAGGTGAGVRGVNFGTNGTFTISGSGATAWSVSGSNFSTSGTGTISLTSASAKTFAGGGFTYTSALDQGGAGALTISGNNTFANITNTYGSTGAATITFTASSTQTVSQFTASGTSGKLLTLNSSSAGTRFNLSDASGFVSVSFCSISDSNATGGAIWNASTANGNVNSGNNIGWEFTSVYYWVGGSGTWNNTSKTNWSSSSGGAGGFGPPISVDTINFDSNSGTGTCTTAATAAGTAITLNSSTLGLTLGAAFTISGAFTLTQGALNLGGFQLSCLNFSTTGSASRSIAFGTSGNITVSGSGATAWNASGSGLITTGTTSTISMTSASAKTFVGGGYTYAAALNQGGAGTLTVTGSNTFDNITNAYGATGATTITFTAGTTQTVSAFTASGTSGKLLTLNSSSAGTRYNLSDASGTVNVSFCSIIDSNATGGARWNSYTSNGNIDGGNNLGWFFTQKGGLTFTSGLSNSNGLSDRNGLVGNL